MTNPNGGDYLDDEFTQAMQDYNQGRKLPARDPEEVETFSSVEGVGQEDTDHLIGDQAVPPGGLTGQVKFPEVEAVRVEDFETLQRLSKEAPPDDDTTR